MTESPDRGRALAAYAGEIGGIQRLFAGLLFGLGAFHLLVLGPYMQDRAALPEVSARIASAQAQTKGADEARKAAEAALAAISAFRGALAAAPDRLRRAIGDLVARGRVVVGPTGDPFKASIRVPREGAQPATEEETITVDEAIRRQIGKDVEALATAFDQAMEPARAIRDPSPDLENLIRENRGAVGRDILSLNEILRQAFDDDPYFWKRWERPGATLAAASVRAEEAMRRIEAGLRAFSRGLADAAARAKARQQDGAAAIQGLQASESMLKDRMAKSETLLGALPLRMDQAARIYPLVALAFALTALVRLRRALRRRAAIGTVDADSSSPSWLVAPATWPGRFWSVALIAAPLLAAAHAAALAVRDPGLFVTALGEPSRAMYRQIVAGYVALGLPALYHFVMAARELLGRPPLPAGDQRRN